MIARKPQKLGRFIPRIIWILACLIVLGRSLAYRNGDAIEAEFFMMLALSWPVSLVAQWGYAAMLDWIPSEGVAGILVMWCFFFTTGYFQWFGVVPLIVRGVQQEREKRAPVSVVPKD